MSHKPKHHSGYPPAAAPQVRNALLTIATRLGELINQVVVVGGIVPYLLVDQEDTQLTEHHVGTMDLDLCLEFAVFAEDRYETFEDRLLQAGLRPPRETGGRRRSFRWFVPMGGAEEVAVDFLGSGGGLDAEAGKVHEMTPGLAAASFPGVGMAFDDKVKVSLHGTLANGATASRDVWVCGPAAFVLLKAVAFANRGEYKDAYDLAYVLRHSDIKAVAARLAGLCDASPLARTALGQLRRDFLADEHGAAAVAHFLAGDRDDAIERDCRVDVEDLLALLAR